MPGKRTAVTTPALGLVVSGEPGEMLDVPGSGGEDALDHFLVVQFQGSFLVRSKMDLGSGSVAEMGFKAGAISAFSDETVGEIIGVKWLAVREVRGAVVREFAVGRWSRISFDALRH